jgi:hypothetical protein
LKAQLAGLILFISGCATTRHSIDRPAQIGSLKLLDVKVVQHNLDVKGTTLGGLSGIDYDAATKQYYLICDDRSSINPARYYTAKVYLGNAAIDSIAFTNVTTLRRSDGSAYPDSKHDPAHTPDPEALRFNPRTGQLVWSSEGERILRAKDTVLEDPAIIVMRPDGMYADSFPIPEILRMHAVEKGPRQNEVLEGMSFADNYRTLWLNVEGPLYEDGPRADVAANDAWIRLFKFDVGTKKNIAQYAYHLDPVAYPSTPPSAFKVNGVPDILWIGDNKMLVMERSFSTGRLTCNVKIFIADLSNADNIIGNTSLRQSPPVKPVTKKLLLNLDDLGIFIDNVEGMTFGPTLPNGHQSLILVSDNNFAVLERTQFFMFEIIP